MFFLCGIVMYGWLTVFDTLNVISLNIIMTLSVIAFIILFRWNRDVWLAAHL
jgi:hypothetical protein